MSAWLLLPRLMPLRVLANSLTARMHQPGTQTNPGASQPVRRRHSTASSATCASCRVKGAAAVLRRRLPHAQIVLLGLLPAGVLGPPGKANHTWPSVYSKALPLVNTRLRCGGTGAVAVTLGCGCGCCLRGDWILPLTCTAEACAEGAHSDAWHVAPPTYNVQGPRCLLV